MAYYALYSGLLAIRAFAGRRPSVLRLIYAAAAVVVTLFVAFRYEVGCDWGGYLIHYQMQGWLGMDHALSQSDPGWWLLLYLIQRVDLPYPAVNILVALIFFAGVHQLARRQPDPFGYLLFLFPMLIVHMPMSGLRQAAAIGFVCFAYSAFLDRKAVTYCVWVAVATLFHSSAMVFLLLAPLAVGKYTRRRLVLAGLLALPGLGLLLLTPAAETASSRYIEQDIVAQGAIFRVGVLALTGLGFLVSTRKHWLRMSPADYSLVSLGAMMMVALLPIVGLSTVIADRFGYYLVPIQMVILARLLYVYPRGQGTILSLGAYAGITAVFLTWMQLSRLFDICYTPYQTWLFGFPSG